MSGFEEFFTVEYPRVVGMLALATGDRRAAEDAAQEAFARAYQKWSMVSQTERPGAWVYVVAVRYARRVSGRERRISARGAAQLVDDAVADLAEARVDALTLQAALARLPVRQRLVVVLRYFAGLSTHETAAAMGCAPGTVKSALHAALRNLHQILEPESDPDIGPVPA
ncbi:MAG: RNA polymerase sigma factor [Acidimicrobiales bacterium]